MLYARNIGERLFSDICEYRVDVKGDEMLSSSAEGQQESETMHMLEHPFPPTSQSHYGPTEMVTELDLQTVPKDLQAQHTSKDGTFEVRFTTSDPCNKLPRITARLRSHLFEAEPLMDCVLIRTLPAPPADSSTLTPTGLRKTGSDLPVPTAAVSAYFPKAGEYALEVFATAADAAENENYFLVWQFLIDSTVGYSTTTPTRRRFATTTLGPKDSTWNQLGLRNVSHIDPLIRIPPAVNPGLMSTKPKADVLQEYSQQNLSPDESSAQSQSSSPVPDDDQSGLKSCDLKIVLAKQKSSKLTIIGQLVDISGEKDEDQTDYLLQEKIEEDDPNSPEEKLAYLVRVATAQHFYKLYIYASRIESEPASNIPLVYTYLIEAPARIGSAERPYVGVHSGPFAEKLERKQQQQRNGVAGQ